MAFSSDCSKGRLKDPRRRKIEPRKSRTLKKTSKIFDYLEGNVLQRRYENDSPVTEDERGERELSKKVVMRESSLTETSSHYNLNNEIEQILSDIYNYEIFGEMIPKDIFKKYEKYVRKL